MRNFIQIYMIVVILLFSPITAFATAKEIGTLKTDVTADLPDNTSGAISPADIRGSVIDTIDSITDAHGWADYADSTYTSGSPLAVLASTDTILPNDGVNGIKTYEPTGLDLYSAGKITGVEGESRLITINFKATPTSGATTFIEVWIDIGGGVGELYRRIVTFPKGNGVEREITLTTFGYTLGTWETNGGTVYVRANGTVDVYDIRYVIGRTSIVD